MATTVQQISPVAHLPLVLGAVMLRCNQICFTIHEQFSR